MTHRISTHQRQHMTHSIPDVVETVARSPFLHQLGSTLAHPPVPRKPRWRGWIHAGFTPVAFVMVLIAVLLAPTLELRIACAIFGVTGLLLFGVSGIYHRSYWSPNVTALLRRMDHVNIALLIAGTYTPVAIALMPDPTVLLCIIWATAIGLAVFRLVWMDAPRWLYTPLYVVMGCIAVAYLPQFWPVHAAATSMIAVGGVAYIAGAVTYALKWPVLTPRTFGFHEVFHTWTVIGFVCHYIAIMLAM
ncbi:MAG: hemolysin III family protein [Kocuria sp.]|nr:hemolysin III family protein [Kocuria sp.]